MFADIYQISITDANGCNFYNGSSEIVISEPDDITVLPVIEDVLCNASNEGFIEASLSGGYGNYSYSWQDQNGNFISNNNSIDNLTAGDYTLTASSTDFNNVCNKDFILTIDEPDEISLVSLPQIGVNSCLVVITVPYQMLL